MAARAPVRQGFRALEEDCPRRHGTPSSLFPLSTVTMRDAQERSGLPLREASRAVPPALRGGARILGRKLRKWWDLADLHLRRDTRKYRAELAFWERYREECGGVLPNLHYRGLMLGLAGEHDEGFLRGRVVADFGCGPCGSLAWVEAARERIGIDVLADAYQVFSTADHGMRYVRCDERRIPLPDASVGVLFTVNALDHVSHLQSMCQELLRILAPDGAFYGSFNLHEPRAACEPQTLTWPALERYLLRHLQVDWYGAVPKVPVDSYRGFREGRWTRDIPAGPAILWVRAHRLRATAAGSASPHRG
jgi:SAM-dependent methyltransferase